MRISCPTARSVTPRRADGLPGRADCHGSLAAPVLDRSGQSLTLVQPAVLTQLVLDFAHNFKLRFVADVVRVASRLIGAIGLIV
jgi:hypothetical protein